MFSPANFIRFALRRYRLPRRTIDATLRPVTKITYRQRFKPTVLVPPSLGFSILTLLGLESETTPEDELIKSIKYSILFIERSELDKAERLLHVALRQAQQMNHESGITYVYDVLANLALQRDQLDKAKKLFVSVAQRLMRDGVTEDDVKIIHISLKLARISHLQREFEIAKTGFEWCLEKLTSEYKRSPSENISKLLAMGEEWYGKLYVECNSPERALLLLQSSHDRTRSLAELDNEHIIIQLNDIATVYEQLDRLEESEKCLKEAVQRGKEVPEMNDLGAVYVNLGRVYLKRGLVEQARKSCGYGWRLAHDRNNLAVKQQAEQCVDDVRKV